MLDKTMSSNDVTYDDGALNIAMSHIVDLGSISNNIIFQFQSDIVVKLS